MGIFVLSLYRTIMRILGENAFIKIGIIYVVIAFWLIYREVKEIARVRKCHPGYLPEFSVIKYDVITIIFIIVFGLAIMLLDILG